MRNVELHIKIRRTPRKLYCLLDDPGMDDLRALMRPTVSLSGRRHSEVAKRTKCFLGLPTELKLEIFRHKLHIGPKRITPLSHQVRYKNHKLLPIALVSHEFKELAYKIYYGENTISLPVSRYRYVEFSLGPWIRKLELQVCVEYSLEWICEMPYHRAVDPRDIGALLLGLEKHTKWQMYFANVIDLKIVGIMTWNLAPTIKTALQELAKQSHMALRLQRVEILSKDNVVVEVVSAGEKNVMEAVLSSARTC
jgi:hypothetical protein